MKGYNLSTDYDMLWEFCQNGYVILGFVNSINSSIDNMSILIHNPAYYDHKRVDCWMGEKLTCFKTSKDIFSKQCKSSNLKYIIPEHDLK